MGRYRSPVFVLVGGIIGWLIVFLMIFVPTMFGSDDNEYIEELEQKVKSLEVEKSALREVAEEAEADKLLYLDSANLMTTRVEEAEVMKKRLIVGYEKILGSIANMPATEHDSFYADRYPDNDN